MKLIFPNGEHAQTLLSDGVNRVGSAPDSQVRLDLPGIAPVHCELVVSGAGVSLRVPDASNPITLNGKPVTGVMALRPNDMLGFGSVQARFAVVEAVRNRPAAAAAMDDDSGATRVRMAVPKYVLRGVSGPAFGKSFPVPSQVVVGRAPECDISIPTEEISRKHVQLRPIPDGLAVEDLGSANGTFINGQRSQQGVLRPGDELRLDTIRFLLVAPGMEISNTQKTVETPKVTVGSRGKSAFWIGAAVIAGVLAAAAMVYFLR